MKSKRLTKKSRAITRSNRRLTLVIIAAAGAVILSDGYDLDAALVAMGALGLVTAAGDGAA